MLNKNIRRCVHIKTNGTQCGSPAARGHELCHFHWRAAKDFPRRRSTQPIPEPVIDLTLIDSPDAIHYALMQVAQGIANGTLSDKQSGRLIWVLQTISSNFKQTSFHRQLEDEYSSSNLNCYQIWDKIKQETEDQQRAELHEKRIAEIKRLEKTCCKCHQVVDAESQLTPTATETSATTAPSPATENDPIPQINACSPSDIHQQKAGSIKSSVDHVAREGTPSFRAAKGWVCSIQPPHPSLQWLDGPITQWPDSFSHTLNLTPLNHQ